jgi:peptidoglycan/xylan/chitin deacetylase (PgdA/CDA1 family)
VSRLARPLLSVLSPSGARGRLSILTFHRVHAQPDPLYPSEADAALFNAICRWVRSTYAVLPLDEAVQRLQDMTLPARAMAITFDDGYADNCELALPILQSNGLTATFFIATGFVDGGCMWNDVVIESIRRTSASRLDLGHAGLGVYEISTPAARRRAADDAIRAIKYLEPEERWSLATHLAGQAGVAIPQDLMMNWDQVRTLRRSGMGIGAHTVNHPILARLPVTAARQEAVQSKARLEEELQEPVRLFAYPNGKPGEDYVPETVDAIRGLGFAAAVTTAPGAANRTSDLFQLPRFTPWDRTSLRFDLRLAANLWNDRPRRRQ